MPVAGAVIALIGMGASAYGAKRQGDRRKREMQKAVGGGMSPEVYWAFQGIKPQSQDAYAMHIWNMTQNPGAIDPAIKNKPFQLSSERQMSDFNRASSILGKTTMGANSGLGDAYALANQAARTARDVNTEQQFGLWQENQKRADLSWLQQAFQGNQQGQMGIANANINNMGPNGWQMAGNAMSGLANVGGGLFTQGQQQGSQGQGMSGTGGGGFSFGTPQTFGAGAGGQQAGVGTSSWQGGQQKFGQNMFQQKPQQMFQ